MKGLNLKKDCKELNLGLWHCPPFIVIMMGVIIIITMLATYTLASRYVDEPEVAALIVIFVTILLIIFGNIIIIGFSKMAEASRMQSEFISIISHQLRSPLSIIKWTLNDARRELQKENSLHNPELLFYTTEQALRQMTDLINTLLEVKRIEANMLVIKQEEVSLAELTLKVVGELQNYAKASNVNIVLQADNDLPIVMGDPNRLQMAVQNLVDNAIRYSQGRGEIEIKITKEKNFLRFVVKDTGIGIPKAEHRKIFQRFFRASNSSRFQTKGTGLGLYTVKVFVEAMGGRVGFESEEKRGSIFWFTLPIKK